MSLDQLKPAQSLDVHTLHPTAGAVRQNPGLADTTTAGASWPGIADGDWLAKSRTRLGMPAGDPHRRRCAMCYQDRGGVPADGAIALGMCGRSRGAHRTIGDALTTCEDTVVAFARDRSAKDLAGSIDVLIQNYPATPRQQRRGRPHPPPPAIRPGRLVAPHRVPRPGHRRPPSRRPGHTPTRPDPMMAAPPAAAPPTRWPKSPTAPWTPSTGPSGLGHLT